MASVYTLGETRNTFPKLLLEFQQYSSLKMSHKMHVYSNATRMQFVDRILQQIISLDLLTAERSKTSTIADQFSSLNGSTVTLSFAV